MLRVRGILDWEKLKWNVDKNRNINMKTRYLHVFIHSPLYEMRKGILFEESYFFNEEMSLKYVEILEYQLQ